MRAALLALCLLTGCAHVTAQQWCQGFCGDREARAEERSTHGTAIATCECRAPVREQFLRDAERSMATP